MTGMTVTGNLAIILGGGRGSRLYPLTKERCKPAVPLGGKYRLIDVPISNCINSGLRNIYIVTQFMSASLNEHIARAYLMDVFSDGFVNVLAATQTGRGKGSEDWFKGTADAVRKCIGMMNLTRYKRVVILSGDQLYKMNYQDLLKTHLVKSGDISIAVLPVAREKVEELGIMRIDGDDRIIEFVEKPQDSQVIESLKVSESFAIKQGLEKTEKRWLANMGIYVFETQVLIDALDDKRMIDFGKDLIPASLSKYKTVAHLFDGYWEDIGTIKSFFEANIQLGSLNPPFDFFGREREKIFTKQRFLTASRFLGAHIGESIISDGCYIGAGAEIIKSVIGIRSRIGASTHVEEAIVMGADSRERRGGLSGSGSTGVCENVVIKRAILDKNVHVGEGAKIINADQVDHFDGEGYYIRDGIVVIPKNTIIPPGKVI